MRDTEIFTIAESDDTVRLFFRDGSSVLLTKEESDEIIDALASIWPLMGKRQ